MLHQVGYNLGQTKTFAAIFNKKREVDQNTLVDKVGDENGSDEIETAIGVLYNMSNMAKLEFPALEVNGKNYMP
ncbi:hypothetical protein LXL04_012448 [Taraxacum kok-saghyz]